MDCRRFLQNMFILVLLISGMMVFSCSGNNRPMTPEAHPKTEEMAMALFKARTIPERIPPLAEMYGDISSEQAYFVQDRLAEKMSEVLGFVKGYKIGYASESVFAELKISEPACGRLFEHQIVADKSVIPAHEFFTLTLEAEVAFKVARKIYKPVNTIQGIKEYIKSVHAAFDISSSWYDPNYGQTVSDFIANTGGSHYFVIGPPVDPKSIDIDNLILKIHKDGENVYEGPSSAVLGSPWNAMKWIANHELNRGYPIQRDYIIVSGKVGPAFIATGDEIKGSYVGDCGGLGRIAITIE